MISVQDLSALGIGMGPDPELASLRSRMRQAYGYGSGGLGALSVDSLVRGAIRSATFRSNVTPPITWDPAAPSDPSTGGAFDAGALVRQVQPTLDVTLASGDTVTIAPGGPAEGDYRVIVGGVVVAVVGSYLLALAIGYALGKRARRRSR